MAASSRSQLSLLQKLLSWIKGSASEYKYISADKKPVMCNLFSIFQSWASPCTTSQLGTKSHYLSEGCLFYPGDFKPYAGCKGFLAKLRRFPRVSNLFPAN